MTKLQPIKFDFWHNPDVLPSEQLPALDYVLIISDDSAESDSVQNRVSRIIDRMLPLAMKLSEDNMADMIALQDLAIDLYATLEITE